MTRDWIRVLRHAVRSLRRTPGFTLLAVGTLGLAIGANALVFSVVDGVLLDPLPFRDADRLVTIMASAPGSDLPDEFSPAVEFYLHYLERSEHLEDAATFNSFTNTLRAADRIERVRMSAPTASLFSTLGVAPILGRLPTPEDESGVVVISHELWTTWFGSDESILGRRIHAGGEDRTVIGVMPADFWFPRDGTLLWFPRTLPTEIETGRFGQPIVARVRPGTTPEQLEAELSVLARELPSRYGGSPAYEKIIEQHRPIVEPVGDALLGDVRAPLWILLAAMGIVLVVACANVAHLFLVRAERRQPELAVRSALGAGRWRLLGGLLAESTIVAGLAGAAAVAVARFGVPLLVAAAPEGIPRLDEIGVDADGLVFTFGLAVVSALLCGFVPAVRFSAPSLLRLREGGRGGMRRGTWGRHALVASQTALALVLLVGSVLLMRSFDRLSNVDPGYRTDDLFTFQIAPEGPHLEDAATYARFHMDFLDRLAALPGVERVGIVENVPLDEGVGRGRFRSEDTPPDVEAGTLLGVTWTAGDYFAAMGIELEQGRAFDLDDTLAGRGNVVVSRSAANALWPGREALGQRLKADDFEAWMTVVGVVDDVLQNDFREPAIPMVYLPLVGPTPETSRTVSSPGYVLRTSRADSIAPEVRALVREVAPTAPMYRIYTMEFLAERSMARLEFTMTTLAVAAVLALILGIVGLYGVLSVTVAERTREIGVRMALGAAAARVRWMVVAQGARVLAVGLVVGLAAAAGVSRFLASLLFEVEAVDPWTYVGVAAMLFLAGLVASYVPARRASRVDPMEALRVE